MMNVASVMVIIERVQIVQARQMDQLQKITVAPVMRTIQMIVLRIVQEFGVEAM